MGEVVSFEARELEKIKRKIEITEACKELFLAYWHLASLIGPECTAAEMAYVRSRPIKLLTREDYERALESKPMGELIRNTSDLLLTLFVVGTCVLAGACVGIVIVIWFLHGKGTAMTEWMTEEEADNPSQCLATRMRRAKNFGQYIDYVAAVTWKGTHTANIVGEPAARFNPVSREESCSTSMKHRLTQDEVIALTRDQVEARLRDWSGVDMTHGQREQKAEPETLSILWRPLDEFVRAKAEDGQSTTCRPPSSPTEALKLRSITKK